MLPRSVPMKACSILFARRHKLRVPVSKTILDADRLGGPELRPRTSPSRVGPEVTPPSRARATGCRSPSHADRAFGERGQSMRILLIYCHPRPDSYCAALREVATEALKSAGHVVEVRDLYAEGFYPVLDAEERGRYYDEGDHRPDISSHVASLLRAEALVFVYPTWWFSPPATLKGWFDRVLAAGRRLPRRRSSGAAATAGGRPAHRRGHRPTAPNAGFSAVGWPDSGDCSSSAFAACALVAVGSTGSRSPAWTTAQPRSGSGSWPRSGPAS